MFTTLDTSQLTKINDYENIQSVNPSYLMIDKLIGHIQEKNQSKYLIFDSTNENKEVLKKFNELWDEIKNEIETINGCKTGEYDKDFINI